MPEAVRSSGEKRVCVIGAGPCGLTALKNLLRAGLRNVVCYEEHSSIGGNWAFTDDPQRASVHATAHSISSRRMSSFDDFPMPKTYPDFPRIGSCSPISPTMQERFSLSRTSASAHVSSNARWAAMAGGRFASAPTARPGPNSSTACWSALVTTAKRSYPHTRARSAAGSCTPRPTSAPTHSAVSTCSWSVQATPLLILPSMSPASPREPRSACAREPTSFRNACSDGRSTSSTRSGAAGFQCRCSSRP